MKSKEIQSWVSRSLLHPLFIKRKLTINITMENTSKSYPQLFLALQYNRHRFYQLWHMIDLFLVFFDRNFFIQHSFSINFWITTRMWVEHSKLSNQALDQMQQTLALTFTTPFSNVPADKLHPQFLATIFGENMQLICGFLWYIYCK